MAGLMAVGLMVGSAVHDWLGPITSIGLFTVFVLVGNARYGVLAIGAATGKQTVLGPPCLLLAGVAVAGIGLTASLWVLAGLAGLAVVLTFSASSRSCDGIPGWVSR